MDVTFTSPAATALDEGLSKCLTAYNFSKIHQSLITGFWDLYGLNLWVKWVQPDPIELNRIP